MSNLHLQTQLDKYSQEAKDDRDPDIDELICASHTIASMALPNFRPTATLVSNSNPGAIRPGPIIQPAHIAYVPVSGTNLILTVG